MRFLSAIVLALALLASQRGFAQELSEDELTQLLENLENERVVELKKQEIEEIRAKRQALAGDTAQQGTAGLRLIRVLGTKDKGIAEFSQGDLVFRVRTGEQLADGSRLVALRPGGVELEQPGGGTRLVMLGAAASSAPPTAVPQTFRMPTPAPAPATMSAPATAVTAVPSAPRLPAATGGGLQ